MRSIVNLIEKISFDAWPSLEERELYGWRIRFSNGYTKRANSANCVSDFAELTDKQVEHVEHLYQERNLQPIFRLTSFTSPDKLDCTLALRGYRYIEPSLVMTAALTAKNLTSNFLLMSGPNEWLHACEQISANENAYKSTHLNMLQLIKNPCAFAISGSITQPVCCGLGVLSEQHFGIFDIATTLNSRGKGLASEFCSNLMSWGYESGAKFAYLQVVASNAAAVRLYENLGFRRAYNYWYRVKA